VAEDSVLLRPPGNLFFPTAFTPDGDGINEAFVVQGHSIEEFSLRVFDRWGHLVFETEEWGVPWDGSVRGSGTATTGVYVYSYKAKGHYFGSTEGYGHVTLIRGEQE
jgi:gliding motility-associated-like protein